MTILGKECSLNWLITQLESSKSLYDILKNDDRLLGILLGYGIESAFQYHNALKSCYGVPEHTAEYCPVQAKKKRECKCFPVVIMGNPNSAEVRSLISTYEQELNIFWKAYRKQDPLTFFLKCICDEK